MWIPKVAVRGKETSRRATFVHIKGLKYLISYVFANTIEIIPAVAALRLRSGSLTGTRPTPSRWGRSHYWNLRHVGKYLNVWGYLRTIHHPQRYPAG